MDDVTTEQVQQLQRTHSVRPVSNPEPIGVNGVQGRSVMMQSSSPFPSANGQQQRERDWLVAGLPSTQLVMFFVFVAPQSEFARFQLTYEAMLALTCSLWGPQPMCETRHHICEEKVHPVTAAFSSCTLAHEVVTASKAQGSARVASDWWRSNCASGFTSALQTTRTLCLRPLYFEQTS
jgi:hypothetical protein